MSASTPGLNLWHKWGWRHLWMELRWRRRYPPIGMIRIYLHLAQRVIAHTFMPVVCAVKGHVIYNPAMAHEPPERACRRCRQYIRK